MNRKAKKAYDKAMDLYEKGKINKALEICEEALSEGLDNSLVLNFKGLLLYQKGDLNGAITVWKINEEVNNDHTAKNYIRDSMIDKKRLDLYKQGEQAIKKFKIDEALGLFRRCAESDFNSIKVNTGIAICYQKKGDLYKAKEYVDKALSIDEDAITAKLIEKQLKEDGMYLEVEKSSEGFLIVITILVVIFAIAAAGYSIMFKFKNTNLGNRIEESKSNEVAEKNNVTTENKESEIQERTGENLDAYSNDINKEEPKYLALDKEKLKVLIANGDLDSIYEQIRNVKEELADGEDAELYKQAIELIKTQGVSKFYEYGLWYFNEGNYTDARISLDKAYAYCEGNNLKEHILFYRASSSLKESDSNSAIVQYEEYYNQYPNGVYIQEVLYELALLSNPVKLEKSKFYANALMNNFPDSIYINDNIASISRS